MAVEDEVRQLRTRVDDARARKARAEVAREQAEASVKSIREQLQTEFGVETPEDAQRTLAELETQLVESVAQVRSDLERTSTQ